MQVGGNVLLIPGQEIRKERRAALVCGWILLIIGLIALVIGLMIYPTWQHNREVLAIKEVSRSDTSEDHAIYNTQSAMMISGFLVGTSMLMGGAYLLVTASSYNRKIEGALIQALQQSQVSQQPPTGSARFCQNCGNERLSTGKFCPSCGKKMG